MPQGAEAPASARLFLALLPGGAEQVALAAHAAAWRWNADVARYRPSDWHLTLHFIGPVPRSRLDELKTALDVPVTPFELRFGEPMLWPHGLAVLLPMATPPALQALHDTLGVHLRQLGLRTDERPYRPHLTLARRAAQAAPPEPPAWVWPVHGYALVESTGRPEARYGVLRRFGDGGQDGGPPA
jgi:2'-5' RNA ligase